MLNPNPPIGFTAPQEAGRKNRRQDWQDQGPRDQVSRGQQQGEDGQPIRRGKKGKDRGAERSREEAGRYPNVGATAGAGGPIAGVAAMYGQTGQLVDLKKLADRVMVEKNMVVEFSREAMQQIASVKGPAPIDGPGIRDKRDLIWCSVDNGYGDVVTSKDLDQLTASEDLGNGRTKIYVAIADVDALMGKDSPVDKFAQNNTTSVYTADKIYPMIPREWSENYTSLNPGVDRLAMVTEMIVNADGEVESYDVYRAAVQSKVALNYESTGAWFENRGPRPGLLQSDDPERQRVLDQVADALQLQNRVAQKLKEVRRRNGSLTLESQEAKAKMEKGKVEDVKAHERNQATELIENIMVAANGCASKFLRAKGFPTLQRIVREPKFWNEIVGLAKELGTTLPAKPNSEALEAFLEKERKRDPIRFPDLSLNVVKLLGRGEYVVEMPGDPPTGHFGLAVRDYSHSTAPNRRYPDVITQRLLKAAIAGEECPYSREELQALALRCTEMEAVADKVERHLSKSAAAQYLSSHIGETYEAVVSGSNDKGTWVRLLSRPIEGKLEGKARMRVGQLVDVKLVSVNVEKGFIDFQALR